MDEKVTSKEQEVKNNDQKVTSNEQKVQAQKHLRFVASFLFKKYPLWRPTPCLSFLKSGYRKLENEIKKCHKCY